ncbi:hypothetical protein Acr_03g0019870 [Actinidia rufa]|uniref:Uncharacterized protein n=1 Tax=Actinidia rufa TaxID=165716 RepID=A0A7J0EFG5_9ERIC|nr:hypothetical protein Acr_03g0019870 [Actinidia rufa]
MGKSKSCCKFSATDAFKLIGEAQRVLLDRQKRDLHDRKCKGSRSMAPNWAPQKASSNTNVGKQPWVQNHFMNKPTSPFTSFNPQHQQPQRQAQPVFPTERKTFWTACPYCSAQATPQGANWSQPACPQQKEVPHQGGAASRKVNGTKRKQKEESSEDSCSESSSASEEDVDIEENGDDLAKQNFGCYREHPRRSTRSKQHVSYDENLSDDDDFGSPSKRAKSSGSVRAAEDPVLKQEAREVNKPDSACMEDDTNKLKRKESAFYEGSFQNGEENTEKENGEIGARKDRDQGSSIPNGKVEPMATSKGNTSGCQVNRKTDLTTEHISSDNCTEDLDDSLPLTPRKAQRKSGSAVTMKISRVELLRFSHQIPAFRLTSERGGTLEGYWELDPAALPITFFRSS